MRITNEEYHKTSFPATSDHDKVREGPNVVVESFEDLLFNNTTDVDYSDDLGALSCSKGDSWAGTKAWHL